MKEKDEFPGWVSELLWESASGVRETIRWSIKMLYAAGYEIRKKEMRTRREKLNPRSKPF